MVEILLATPKENTLAQLITALSKKGGVALSLAESGKAALDLVSRQRYDLVVVDERLDDMTGLELVEHIIRVNAMINCAAVSDLPGDDFHEASEGLGLIAQVPSRPRAEDAEALLERLRTITGLGIPPD